MPTIESIPQALFSCAFDCCRQETTYPANMLYWHPVDRKWVCEFCWDYATPIEDSLGRTDAMTLEAFIRSQNIKASDIANSKP